MTIGLSRYQAQQKIIFHLKPNHNPNYNRSPVQLLPSVLSTVPLRPPGTLCQEQLLTTTHWEHLNLG